MSLDFITNLCKTVLRTVRPDTGEADIVSMNSETVEPLPFKLNQIQ